MKSEVKMQGKTLVIIAAGVAVVGAAVGAVVAYKAMKKKKAAALAEATRMADELNAAEAEATFNEENEKLKQLSARLNELLKTVPAEN